MRVRKIRRTRTDLILEVIFFAFAEMGRIFGSRIVLEEFGVLDEARLRWWDDMVAVTSASRLWSVVLNYG